MPRYDDSVVIVADAHFLKTLRRNKNCHKCNIELKSGDRVIQAGMRGRLKVYHEKCWVRY